MTRRAEISLKLSLVVTLIGSAAVSVVYIESRIASAKADDAMAIAPVAQQTNDNTTRIAAMGQQLSDVSDKVNAIYGFYVNQGLIKGSGRVIDLATSSTNNPISTVRR